MNKPIEDQMLYVSFNQDSSCFAIGTQRGFKIYSSYPLKNAYEALIAKIIIATTNKIHNTK